MENSNEKILVIRYGTIGDTIFASAFFRELRNLNPNAQIDAFVDNIAKNIMEYCPYINNLVPAKGKYKDFFYYYKLFKQYDTIYFLKNDNFLSKIAFLARVKNRIGFNLRRNFMLTKKFPYNNDRHEIDFYLSLLDVQVKNSDTEVWTAPSNEKVSDIIKGITRKKVLIHGRSRFSQKNWIKDNWVEVVKYLSNMFDMQIFFAGSDSDKSYYDDILKSIDYLNINPINLCGELKINETLSLVKEMDLVLGIDSGVIHMAAALDIKSILLNGPTSLVRWQPRSSNCTILTKNFECAPCCFDSGKKKLCKNKDSKCMKAITVQDVIDAINSKI